MLAGLDKETATILGVMIGTALAAIWTNMRGAKAARQGNEPEQLSTEHIDEEFVGVKGEVRTARQEVRLEHKETRALICDEHRHTRDDLVPLRDLLIEIRAEVRRPR